MLSIGRDLKGTRLWKFDAVRQLLHPIVPPTPVTKALFYG